MLRILTNEIRCARSLPILLETNCWRNRIGPIVGAPQRWKSDEVRSYKAAILAEFDKKLTVESIKNRAKLGDGMVSTSILSRETGFDFLLLLPFLQVRVGVSYCSLNLIDVQYMEQKNDEIILPMIPGSEFSGEILEIGDNCKQNFKPGDKVASLLGTNRADKLSVCAT